MQQVVDVIHNRAKLFKLVYKPLNVRRQGNRGSVKCKLCKIKIHYRTGRTSVLTRHIKFKHRSILLAACFNNIAPQQWLKLFEYVHPEQTGGNYKFVQCKDCKERFENLYSQQPFMLNHIKAVHPNSLLTVWRF